MKKFKLRRHEIILIAGFWIIGCALIGGIFYFVIYSSLPTTPPEGIVVPQATYTLTYTENTAKIEEIPIMRLFTEGAG